MADDRLVLVTGAAGKTGLAGIRALSARGARVRALIRHPDQTQTVRQAGATDILAGDLTDQEILSKAMGRVSAVYLLLPNLHPNETEMGLRAIEAAKKNGLRSIVYHSVLFPQIQALPHHWQKLRVEEALIQSGLDFTILQPASYMQNINPSWGTVKSTGNYRVPFSINAEFSLIDLKDVAAAACTCLLESGHEAAIYPLAGVERLSSIQMAEAMGKYLGSEVLASEQPLDEWRDKAVAAGLSLYALDTLSKMFTYYGGHGFVGSPQTLEWLIGRSAIRFSQYLETMST